MKNASCFVLAAALLYPFLSFSQNELLSTESGQPLYKSPCAGLFEHQITTTHPTPAYEPIRQADIVWEKHLWREIDTREKLNLPFRFPDEPFIEILTEALASGDMQAYADEMFEKPLSNASVDGIIESIDTVRVIDPINQTETVSITRNVLNPEEIVRYRLREIWYFDKETSRLGSRIMAIAPVKEYYDENTGVFKYEAPLFWIHYPDARDVLSQHTSFNPGNDAGLLTWTDVFEMRMFSSFIYKESNVQDMRLKDIYPEDGLARLMEGDRIESELFNWEHDLWTY